MSANARPSVVDELLAGNARFVRGRSAHPHQDTARRASLTGGQAPRTAILSCSDSRAAIEVILDQGLGDVFVIRNAGHVLAAGDTTQASVEFAVAELHVEAILVLGHTSCGAVAATVADLQGAAPLPGALPSLVDLTAPHLDPSEPAQEAVSRHAAGTARDLLASSAIVRDAEAAGELEVAAGVYDIASGMVTLVDVPA